MISVASVPAGHPYVTAVTDPKIVALLADPVPAGTSEPGRWWPPRWLDPAYLHGRIDEVDVLHVHFGFEAIDPSDLTRVCGVLDRHGVPLVLTVHDLHNPHVVDLASHRARLEVLVSSATEVVTLTHGARTAIRSQWGRDAIVLPHPHLLTQGEMCRERPARQVPVVAVHGKALRANIDPWPVLAALTEFDCPPWHVRLDLDHQAFGSPRGDRLIEHLRAVHDAGVDVRVHEPFTDVQLSDYLADIDVLVLPYRFGSHSGWAEVCHDAGVRVVAPSCGYFAEQHPCSTFAYDTSSIDADGLRSAVARALETPVEEPRLRAERRVLQRRSVRNDMVSIYRRALAAERAA